MSSTLLLLPGLLCDEAVWAPQVQAFSGRLQCVVPDYGLRDSIVAMAEHVLATAPSPTFALAGHSMGGRVALQVMRLAPERVERLALLDTSALPLPSGEAGENEREIRMVLLELAQARGMRTMGAQWLRSMVHKDAKHGPVFDAILDMLDRSSPAQYAAQVKALLSRPDSTPVLPTIACPTMVLCGRDDHVSTPEQHQTMAEAIPQATLTIIEHCGHMAPMEKPAQVNAAMQEWLAR
jgi:pimeloyl-ACP methyl ester carboxylesterase